MTFPLLLVFTGRIFQQTRQFSAGFSRANPPRQTSVQGGHAYEYLGQGLSLPHVIDRQAVLRSFGAIPHMNAAEDYLRWLHEVAEAKWDLSELPWWVWSTVE